jgi:3',5'-cyclic AMP phosphodiesterase CpdA
MTVLAHISDLHFGAEDPAIVSGLIAELSADPPDLVVISGDLTQGARRTEFRAAHDFIAALPSPTLAVPGNHDITPYDLVERFTDPYTRWRTAIDADIEPTWCDGTVAVLGLNTARRAAFHWDWSRGRVDRARLERIVERLAAVPRNLVRIVVAHHPLMAAEDKPRMVVAGNARRALAAFRAADARLVLSGHVHLSYRRFSSPDGSGPLVVQCATTTSVRRRGEPNAYNRITVTPDAPARIDVRVWSGDSWESRDRVRIADG